MSDQQTSLPALVSRGFAAAAEALAAVTARRGMTSVLVGSSVLVLAWVGERDSAWGFPMLVAGLALIALGLIGPRLSGSLSLRWGEDGAFFQLTSTIAPPGQRGGAPALTPGDAERTEGDGLPAPALPPTEIEGDAETIEISATAPRGPAAEPPAADDGDAGAAADHLAR